MKVKNEVRVRVPTVLQMEAVECGAASLAMILAYWEKHIPLEEVRHACGVSRDGSKASNILKAARSYGLEAKGYRKELDSLKEMQFPVIIHWNFNHFVVLEGYGEGKFFLNDPGNGPRTVTEEEFDKSFTGVVMTFAPGPDFQKSGERPNFYKGLLLRLKGSETTLVFVVLIGLLLVLPGLVIPTFSKIFIDDVLLKGKVGWLLPLLLGMAITALMRGVLTWFQQYYLLKLQTKMSLSTSAKFLWHILRLPVEFFAQRASGNLSVRVQSNERIVMLLSGQLATNGLNLLMIIFYFILMLQYNVFLALISLVIAGVNMFYLNRVSRQRKDQNQKLLQEEAKFYGTSMSGLQIIETLKATGSEPDFFSRWSGFQTNALNARQEIGVSTQYLSAIPTFLSVMANAAILITGGFLIFKGYLTIGGLVAFQSLLISFMEPVNGLVSLGGQLQEIEGDIKRLDDVLQYPVDDRVLEEPEHKDTAFQEKLQGYLELKDITFGYSPLEPPLIENFNLKLEPGSRVALVGGSGSGKSTVAKLISGLYKPWSGEILFDGMSRSEVPRIVMNSSLAMVDQDICMFEGSVRENLTLWDDTISEFELVRAAKDACVHDDITSKPGGYDHVVVEAGSNFSGGQRQRLEIARALTTNPAIIVLDEATSALDPLTEKSVDENIRRRGCTCVIVAHRLSTIRDCDEIIVLDKGKVVQRGDHEGLISLEGHYARLIRTG